MAQLMLVDDDQEILAVSSHRLRTAGHTVVTAHSGRHALELLEYETIDLVMAELQLPDMSGLDILRHLHDEGRSTAFVVVTGFGSMHEAAAAMRLGAADFLEKPVSEENLLRCVQVALDHWRADAPPLPEDDCDGEASGGRHESHAAARWARILVPVIDAHRDPRTVLEWSRLVFASPGTIRSWCRMAGLSPRRSLVFARLLRAVFVGHGGKHKPENLLDVVDRRTLTGFLRLAGLNPEHDFPNTVDEFLALQTLVRDPDALQEVSRALLTRRDERRARSSLAVRAGQATALQHQLSGRNDPAHS